MKEVVSLFIGQAGVQMGNSLWELICAEHGINEQGTLQEQPLTVECLETFFGLSGAGKFVPRALFIDLEPTVVDQIRTGSYKKLYHPDRLITGPEDAASNFARGFFTVGKLLLGTINNETRRLLENVNCIQGIFLFRSLGGGTGAGLTSAIFDGLAEYPKITKVEIPIYPSPTLSSSMVEPYNCLLGEHFCMEDIDFGLLIDNEALYDICTKYLTVSNPTFGTINRLIAQLCSSITASVRFESVLSCDMTVLQTNLVPYPRIHFPLANFAPILSEEKAQHIEMSVMEITRYVFERENQMMKVDHSFGRFMSCSLFYRGNASPYNVYQALTEIKRDKRIEFVDWCPTGFKIGINVCPPTSIPASMLAQTNLNVTMLTNTSAIGQAWQRLTHKFYLLYTKRSFVHWFVGEGMEECEFTESLYNISALVKDYEEAAMDTKYDEGEGVVETSVPSAPATNGSINHDNAGAQAQDQGLISTSHRNTTDKNENDEENKTSKVFDEDDDEDKEVNEEDNDRLKPNPDVTIDKDNSESDSDKEVEENENNESNVGFDVADDEENSDKDYEINEDNIGESNKLNFHNVNDSSNEIKNENLKLNNKKYFRQLMKTDKQ